MTHPEFKPEDFHHITIAGSSHQELANHCNAKLREWLGPEVVQYPGGDRWVLWQGTGCIKRANLFGIQEIAQKKCEHNSPSIKFQWTRAGHETTCSDCGKRLVAEWKEAE